MRRFYRQASSLQQWACQSTFLSHATRSSFLIGFALRLCIYPEHAYCALCWGWDSNPHTPITLLMTVYKTVTIPQFNVSCMWFEHILQHRKCRVLTLIRTGHTNPRLSEYVLLQFTVSLLYHIHLTILPRHSRAAMAPWIFERKTGLKPATFTVEGWRSINWVTSAFFVPLERVELSEQQILNLSAMPIRVQRLKEQIHYYWPTAQQKAKKAAIPEISRIFYCFGRFAPLNNICWPGRIRTYDGVTNSPD